MSKVSYASNVSTPGYLSSKKKKSVHPPSSSKNFPPQTNKVTDYLMKSTPVPGPLKSVSVNTDTSIDGVSINTPPMPYPDMATTTVTSHTGTNIDSSYMDIDSCTCSAGLDLNRICMGCNNSFFSCYEGKLHKICLHSVLDYLEKKDFKDIMERAVRKVYYNTFLFMIKAEFSKDTD